MELWDAYDKDLNIVNDISLVRGKPILEGLFHLVCDILVKHIDGTYLLMQRDTKKSYGGMWEATAGGSALRGETSLDCAFRELYEETGIKADKLEEIGRDSDSNTIYVEFLCVTDCEKDSIKLQPGETMAYKWVNRSELMSLNAETLITERIPKMQVQVMKTLYMIGGPMGVGKTTVCQQLKRDLQNSVFLDGDWCWDSSPFRVTSETKKMVIDNICYLLNNFLRCSAYENIIFCWVMDKQSIMDSIIERLDLSICTVKCISLVASEDTLRQRLSCDVERSVRTADVIERSVSRIPLFQALDTVKIDTDRKTIDMIVDEILIPGSTL